MGEVLVARQVGAHQFERLVAIKRLRPDRARQPGLREMFLDEAKIIARVSHPAVTHVYDFGEEDGALFLAMELLSGVTLSELARAQVEVPAGIAVQIVAEVCRGLHAAHEASDPMGRHLGVVHRDISPQNIILTFDGQPKIIDFGIALTRDRQAPATAPGFVRGKLAYLAPEQMVAAPTDARTDVFATSLVLHELLTGKTLFGTATMIDRAKGLVPILAPSAIVGPLPKILDDAVLRGLADDPKLRFQTAAEMGDALDAVATEMGGPTMSAWTRTNLAELKQSHTERLRKLVDQRQPPTPNVGRRAPTAVDVESDTLRAAPAPQPTATNTPEPESTLVIQADAPRWPIVLVAIACLGIALVVTFASTQVDTADAPEVQAPAAVRAPQPVTKEPVTPAIEAEAPAAPVPTADVVPLTRPPKHNRAPARRRNGVRPPTEPVAPIEAPAQPALGRVTFGARPYAQVRIDGEPAGVTPLLDHALPAGPHRVEFVDPVTGSVRFAQEFEVEPGGKATLLAPPLSQ